MTEKVAQLTREVVKPGAEEAKTFREVWFGDFKVAKGASDVARLLLEVAFILPFLA